MNTISLYQVRFKRLVPIAAVLLFSAVAQGQTAPAMSGSMPMGHMQKGAAGAHDMKASMTKGMDEMQKMQMTGNVDKDFAMMMKMHHQQALHMAEMELAHGKSSEMKAMATKIIAAQKKEISQLDQWMAKQK